MIKNILTIAGSDCSGGAGIQADIKAISATGSYACSVITALTAQNTQGVSEIHAIPSAFIAAQCDAIFQDLEIDAIKIGMLNDVSVIQCLAKKLQQYPVKFIVLDPVMVATSGAKLLQDNAQAALVSLLFPLATIITPNLIEASYLLNIDPPTNNTEVEALIRQLQRTFSTPILLKGGHGMWDGYSHDWLITPKTLTTYKAPRVSTENTHGTGCSLSSALASYLAQGLALPKAVQSAKDYVTHALSFADGLNVGHKSGPVDHFFAQRS